MVCPLEVCTINVTNGTASITIWLLIQFAFMGFDHVNKICHSLLLWTWNLLEVSLDCLSLKKQRRSRLALFASYLLFLIQKMNDMYIQASLKSNQTTSRTYYQQKFPNKHTIVIKDEHTQGLKQIISQYTPKIPHFFPI